MPIPVLIIAGLLWKNNYPYPAETLSQPLKGFYLLFFSLIVAALVAPVILKTIGGGVYPPTPFAILFAILSVVVTLWLVIAWQSWPMTAITSHPAYIGFGTLGLVYLIDAIIYRLFMNFSFFQASPVYVGALDPGGLFNAWDTVSFGVTAAAVLLLTVEFDGWPLSTMFAKRPELGRQPLAGILSTFWMLLLSSLIWGFFVKGLGTDPAMYLVRVPVCMIFGEFMMLNLFQTVPFRSMQQPQKGIALLVVNVLLGFGSYYLYFWFSILIAGKLAAGPPAYALEIWIANALLSVTFPIISVYTGYFDFWPLKEHTSQEKTASTSTHGKAQ